MKIGSSLNTSLNFMLNDIKEEGQLSDLQIIQLKKGLGTLIIIIHQMTRIQIEIKQKHFNNFLKWPVISSIFLLLSTIKTKGKYQLNEQKHTQFNCHTQKSPFYCPIIFQQWTFKCQKIHQTSFDYLFFISLENYFSMRKIIKEFCLLFLVLLRCHGIEVRFFFSI